MASIKKIQTKNGVSFKITACNGYDREGKKVKKTTTYKPDRSQTPKQQEKAAEKFAMEFEDKLLRGVNFDAEKISFEEFSEQWLADMKNNLEYSTYHSYEKALENKLVPFFKGYKMARINTPLVEGFYQTMINDYTRASVQKYSNILSGMFGTAIRLRLFEINPCAYAKIPRCKKKEAGIKFFTPKQSLIFLRSLEIEFEQCCKGHERIDDTGIPYHVPDYTRKQTVPTQFKVFFRLCLGCGLRKGEALALHWTDIDFEKNELHITKSVAKGEEGVTYKAPKTMTSIRTASVPEDIIPLLKLYRIEYNQLRLSLGDAWQGDENLFIQDDGKLMGRSTSYHYFTRHLRRYNQWVAEHREKAKEEGFEELPAIPIHGLRHSCATLLNHLGMNIIDIANILGHAQTSTTMNIYAHSFEDQKRVASDKINEYFRKNV